MASKSPASGCGETGSPEKIEVVESSVVNRRFYDCILCKRGFTTAQALGGHMNIHRRGKRRSKVLAPVRTEDLRESYWPYPRLTSEKYALIYFRKAFMFSADELGVDEMDLRFGMGMHDHYGNESGRVEEKGCCDEGGLDLELRLGPVKEKYAQSKFESR